jgi:hypothetical protein
MARKVSEYCTLSHKTAQPAPWRQLRHEDYVVLPKATFPLLPTPGTETGLA